METHEVNETNFNEQLRAPETGKEGRRGSKGRRYEAGNGKDRAKGGMRERRYMETKV